MKFSIKVHDKPLGNWRTGITFSLEIPQNSYGHAPLLKGLKLVSPCCSGECSERRGAGCLKIPKGKIPIIIKLPPVYIVQSLGSTSQWNGECDERKGKFTSYVIVPPGYLRSDIEVEEEVWVNSEHLETVIERLKEVPVILTEQLKDGLNNPAKKGTEFTFTKDIMQKQEVEAILKTKPARRLIA